MTAAVPRIYRQRLPFRYIFTLRSGSGHTSRRRVMLAATREARSPSRTEHKVHFIGIGGTGVSALAIIALSEGYSVSGSDIRESAQLRRIEREGGTCFVGHSTRNAWQNGVKKTTTTVGGSRLLLEVPDAMIVSSAVPTQNVELGLAKKVGIPMYNRSQWLARNTRGREVVAIAGTHGKTTTSAALSVVLRELGFDITALVGGQVPQFPGGANAIGGTDKIFVIEADEYDGAFLGLIPDVAIITSVDFDHPDMFKSLEDVQRVFARFTRRVRPGGCIVACGDDVNVNVLRAEADDKVRNVLSYIFYFSKTDEPYLQVQEYVTYGFDEGNSWRAIDISMNVMGGLDFVATHDGKSICELSISSPGRHNVLNALAVFVSAMIIWKSRLRTTHTAFPRLSTEVDKLSEQNVTKAISTALRTNRGVSRRIQHVGTVGSCEVYDDYAHHPTAIRAVVSALRQQFGQAHLIVVFQPHTYSRTVAMRREFSEVLSLADRVIIAPVYNIRAESESGGSHQTCGEELSFLIGNKSICINSFRDILHQVLLEVHVRGIGQNEKSNTGSMASTGCVSIDQDHCRTVLVTMGAGDSNELSRVLHSALGSTMQRQCHSS